MNEAETRAELIGHLSRFTSTNKRMAVPGLEQPSTQMPAALVVAVPCPMRSGGVRSQASTSSAQAAQRHRPLAPRHYAEITGGHFAMRKR